MKTFDGICAETSGRVDLHPCSNKMKQKLNILSRYHCQQGKFVQHSSLEGENVEELGTSLLFHSTFRCRRMEGTQARRFPPQILAALSGFAWAYLDL